MTFWSVIDLQPPLTSLQRGIELALTRIDACTDRVMLAHLRRPFLVMRTLGSFNHPGPDEAPIAILLRQAALKAAMGHDPTIGGPGRGGPPGRAVPPKKQPKTTSLSFQDWG